MARRITAIEYIQRWRLHAQEWQWASWDDPERPAEAHFEKFARSAPDWYAAHVSILESVNASGLREQFVGFYDRGDLYFASAAVNADARDFIRVWDKWRVPAGIVRVSHQAYSGLEDQIDRPIAEAVPLFWRFVNEKFGIYADPARFKSITE